MRRHFMPLPMRLVHDRAQLIQRECRNVIEHAVFPHAVDRSLYTLIQSAPWLICSRTACRAVLRPIHHLHSVGHRHLGAYPSNG